MLWNTNDLEHCAIHATDGDIGHVTDFYFDDLTWVIRYLVVDTGGWLFGRKVLISPLSIGYADWGKKTLSMSITREQVKNSPDINTAQPVSRQHELQLLGYYNYPDYWGGAGFWDGDLYPGMMPTEPESVPAPVSLLKSEQAKMAKTANVSNAQAVPATQSRDDPRLHSCKTVEGYRIAAVDGDIGHVASMLVDQEAWTIRYVIVDTAAWSIGNQVLVQTQWIDEIRWSDDTVAVNVTRDAMKNAPVYDGKSPFDRKSEMALHQYYDRPGYWMREVDREEVLSPD